MELDKSFRLTSVSRPIPLERDIVSPLGHLAVLVGVWKGQGFNQIWRPFQGGPPTQDRFLELNETIETLEFEEIPGDIPNRGLLQVDINLHGVDLEQVQDANVRVNGELAGIHVEPGLWLTVPLTTNPDDPLTVTRLANIPHGTSFVAQGVALPDSSPPDIPPVSITPFTIDPPNTLVGFPAESTLTNPSQFRTSPGDIPNVNQAMVDDPNTLLRSGLVGKKVISTIKLNISTLPLNPPTSGGGTSNIAFLQGTGDKPNALAARLDATFWLETLSDGSHQLQYSQKVLLNFNGLSWPHVSVATLTKQPNMSQP